jgi:hypothetical protein
MATAAKKTKVEAERRELVEELLDIHVDNRKIFERVDAIKAKLKKIATDSGVNFQEVIIDKGKVSVSGATDKRFIGEVPEVDAEAFLKLTEAKRARLLAGGIVRLVQKWAKAYYGKVTVETFPAKS